MARLRKTSLELETARQRLAALKEFTPKPDFGSGLTLESYEAIVNACSAEQDAYNGEVSLLDDRTNLLDSHEQELAVLNQRILAAVKGAYGPDRSEYERVGGSRSSDRKKRTSKPEPKAA
ncbi:MAG TPA: hypothetical protein VE961_25735 [Pyrinomonadaceae bacterium]|nr:hypothetical protein [Pyrinomonadaceae bacterium]